MSHKLFTVIYMITAAAFLLALGFYCTIGPWPVGILFVCLLLLTVYRPDHEE